MRARLWPVLLAVIALLAAQAATADPVGRYPYLTATGGFTTFDGDFSWPNGRPLTDKPYIGGRLGYQLGPLWALELVGDITPTTEDVAAGITDGTSVSFRHTAASVVMSPWATRVGGPYFFVGGGVGHLSTNPTTDPSIVAAQLNQGLLEAGGGLRLWLTDGVGVKLEAREAHWLPKEAHGAPSANYVTLTAGLTFALGAKGRDTDGDAVPDSRDKCPDTPRGATVDAKGCPIDSDGDAVFDGLDKCPETPRGCTVGKTGCQSDADGDFVCDGLDQCADTPKGATVDEKGCPSDADGDGVLDGIDQCADTPKGCSVDTKGCTSDADGDSVCDGVDQCPNTPAGLKVDSAGCPVADTIAFERGIVPLRRIYFETNKAILLPESETTLTAVGDTLARYPNLRIEVQGHTDSRGTDEYNQALSRRRAQAVRSYLLKNFKLKPRNLISKGYGESQLEVSPETTDQDYLKNRRVMLKVLNPEVLPSNVKVEQR
jgi:outer membrane protein OmpA-like peptidoglycan-associated protein